MLNLNAGLTKAGKKYSTLWSEDFTDDFFVKGLNKWLAKGEVKHSLKHVTPLEESQSPRGRSQARRGPGRSASARSGDHGHLRRRLHGHVQRHHPGRIAQPAGRVQGTAQPIGPLLRDHPGFRRRGSCRPQVDGEQGHEVRHRPESRERSHRRANPYAMQNVRRRRAAGRRFRLQPDRHSIPTRLEGPAAGQRLGRGHVEQRRPPAGQEPRRQASSVRRPAGRAFQRGR